MLSKTFDFYHRQGGTRKTVPLAPSSFQNFRRCGPSRKYTSKLDLPTLIKDLFYAQSGQPNAEYQRFKQEIIDSQIFDRLKLELGIKKFNKLVKEKLCPVPLDLVSFLIKVIGHSLTINLM